MELVVVRGGGHRVGALLGHRGVDLAQPRDRLGRELRRGAHGQALEQDDHRVALAHLDLAQRRDGEGAAVLGPHEAVALQAAQRLAHDGRVDLELAGQLLLVQPRAGGHLAAARSGARSRSTCVRECRAPWCRDYLVGPRDSRSARRSTRGYVYSPGPTGQSAKGARVDLNDTPEQAEYRAEGARLAAGAQGAGARGAQHARRGRGRRVRRRAPALAGQARRGRPGRRHLAGRRRRPGAGPDRAGHRQPGDRARRRARHPRRHRRRHARADDHRPRHRGAEGALPRARCSTATRSGASCSPSRPPARTSRRCRRARAARTTARGCSTARRCGRPTRSSPPTACCWRAPTPSSTSTRA